MPRSLSYMVALPLLAPACAGADIGQGGDPGLDEIEFAADNGIFLDNGLNLPNGMNLGNGTALANGMNLGNGVDLPNGMNLGNGLYAPPAGSGLEQWLDVDPPARKKILRYLIECALPAGTAVELEYRGGHETLGYGIAGLGPSLQDGMMNDVDQQRVTACLLARVNGSGETVQIDLFGPMGPDAAAFDSASSADAAFTVTEAAFFGNLVSAAPEAHACQAHDYPLADVRSCKDLGGGAHDCGVLQFTATTCPADLGNAFQCNIALAGGSGRPYYTECLGDAKRWRYVLTAYLAPKQVWEACATDGECASYDCDAGTCASASANGESCTSDVQCQSGVCDAGIYGARAGARCYSSSQCASNVCSANG